MSNFISSRIVAGRAFKNATRQIEFVLFLDFFFSFLKLYLEVYILRSSSFYEFFEELVCSGVSLFMRLYFQELVLQQLVFLVGLFMRLSYHEIVCSFREYVFSGVLFSRGLYRSLHV